MKIANAKLVLLLAVPLFLSGCASTGDNAAGRGATTDPFESVNRKIYKVNDTLDKAILKPVATGYKAVAPSPVQDGVRNFFSNINDVIVIVNDLLQLKFAQAASDTGRFAANSTVGLLGLVDVASRMGLPKHNEDFGQTLGVWGLDTGPYLVLPLFGPSNTRDGVGLIGDFTLDPVSYVDPTGIRLGLSGVRTVDTRANLLRAGGLLDQAALDPYTFLRDAYLQRRRSLVYDGSPPLEDFEDFGDFEDPESAAPANVPATSPDPAGEGAVEPAEK